MEVRVRAPPERPFVANGPPDGRGDRKSPKVRRGSRTTRKIRVQSAGETACSSFRSVEPDIGKAGTRIIVPHPPREGPHGFQEGHLTFLPVRKGQEPRGFRGTGGKPAARKGEERSHSYKTKTHVQAPREQLGPKRERRIQPAADRVSPRYLPVQGQPAMFIVWHHPARAAPGKTGPTAPKAIARAFGAGFPRGQCDRRGETRTLISPCLGPFEPASSTLTNDSPPAALARAKRKLLAERNGGGGGPAAEAFRLCKPRASGGTAYGVDTRQNRSPAP